MKRTGQNTLWQLVALERENRALLEIIEELERERARLDKLMKAQRSAGNIWCGSIKTNRG
jgi:hypothetical protein